jgi:hypothetical protein
MIRSRSPADMNADSLLNDFAIRCFRDVADYDYIHSRLAYRSRLFPQFQWSALQALEKYFKAILLLNRIAAKKIGHDLGRALQQTTQLPFELKLSPSSRKLVDYLDTCGRFRYLESSFHIYGPKLVALDKAVWEVRRYCKVLNYQHDLSDGTKKDMLGVELARIDQAESRPPNQFSPFQGELEKIIREEKHPARPALVWQNAFFGKRFRKSVRMHLHMQATNAPLWLHPEILDEAVKYVHVPRDVEKAYREELARRSNGASGP